MIRDRHGMNCHALAIALTLTLTLALLFRSSSSPTSHSKALLISVRVLCPFRIAARAMAAHTRLHFDRAFHSLSMTARQSIREKRRYAVIDMI